MAPRNGLRGHAATGAPTATGNRALMLEEPLIFEIGRQGGAALHPPVTPELRDRPRPVPLGSCTMKHNPRLNEKVARLPGFADVHPLQPQSTVQGALEVIMSWPTG
jgi:glycine dehydrogenase subunit 2